MSIAQPRERPQPIVDRSHQGLDDRRAAARRREGTLAGDGLVEHHAQAVDIRPAVDRMRRWLAQRLQVFRRHVVDRAPQRGRIGGRAILEQGLACQVEVKEHRHAVGR